MRLLLVAVMMLLLFFVFYVFYRTGMLFWVLVFWVEIVEAEERARRDKGSQNFKLDYSEYTRLALIRHNIARRTTVVLR